MTVSSLLETSDTVHLKLYIIGSTAKDWNFKKVFFVQFDFLKEIEIETL